MGLRENFKKNGGWGEVFGTTYLIFCGAFFLAGISVLFMDNGLVIGLICIAISVVMFGGLLAWAERLRRKERNGTDDPPTKQ